MQTHRFHFKNNAVSIAVVIVLSLFVPMSAYADATNPDTTTTDTTTQTVVEDPATNTTPISQSTDPQPSSTQGSGDTGAKTNGTNKPNGSASNTFSYNTETGLWENEHYYWDPISHQTKPKSSQTYSYNPSTGKWDTADWQFDPAAGKYTPNTYSVSQLPSGYTSTDGPNSPVSVEDNQLPNGSTNALYNGFFNGSISNNNSTQAATGNALIDGNTYAGNATTGNATAISNLFNLLQSSANFLGGDINTFNANIQGNMVGDLLINPGAIGGLTAASATNPVDNLTVNNQSNGVINNNLVVDASSGNASILNNTNAGSATTGNANAVANVINMLNSAVSTGQSFLGNINIYGNLDGDILLPPGFLDSLLASNAAPSASSCSSDCSGSTTANIVNNSAINNNINSNAATGNAAIANNSTAGSATTGNAANNVTLLNLTGHEIVGKNSLLVFVNVLGQWYGMIMDAPAGTTAATLGGGISQDTATAELGNNSTLNNTNNSLINNNIDVNATSGDATIANNTHAGDATTGNATTSVNLANFVDSHLALSDWFGILFVNVFGTWNGSFGVDTIAGNPASTSASQTAGSTGTTSGDASSKNNNVFNFVPKAATAAVNTAARQTTSYTGQTMQDSQDTQPHVMGATHANTPSTPTPSVAAANHTSPSWLMPIIGSLIAALLLGAEQAISKREKRRPKMPVVPQTGHITTA